jgi:nitroreductase
MHREFTGDSISREELERLVWAATRAPSAANTLLRRLIVVTDPRLIRTLRQVTPGFVAVGATAVIAICSDVEAAERELGPHARDISSYIDVGAAGENIALAAAAIDLGVCFVRSCTDPAIRAVLELPRSLRPDLLVAIGRIPERPVPAPRAAVPIVFRDRFGDRWA